MGQQEQCLQRGVDESQESQPPDDPGIAYTGVVHQRKERRGATVLPEWNREQHSFIKHSGTDIVDPRQHNIVIDVTHTGLEGAVRLIFPAYARKSPRAT